jgi:sortase (surface protein transpeptidase)
MDFPVFRRRPSRSALALLLGLMVVLPAPSLAATSPRHLTDAAPPTIVNEWSLDTRVDEHAAERPMVIRNNIVVWRFEAILAARQAIEAARLAAEQAAKEAAQKAAAAAAAKAAATKATTKTTTTKAAPAYSGTNHMWIPALGMSRSVSGFACSRSTPPANKVYRWGCAGKNNVYLFGHAWGVMKPLHDGYLNGKVKKGMKVVFADAKGHVHTYRVTEIRVVTPDQVSWAIAAQKVPSMTLQTCLGANSEKRLLVRLVIDS